MKVLFKNTTKYTKENCDSFLEFHTNKYGKRELLKVGLIGICILYIFIFNIIYKNWLLVLGAIFLAGIIYLIEKNKSAKQKKSRKKVKEFTFYFYEKHIKIKYRREFERLKYFQIHKVFETDKYFFIYLDEKSSLILNKEGFEIGTAKGFSKFIKGKCPLKYKRIDDRNEDK